MRYFVCTLLFFVLILVPNTSHAFTLTKGGNQLGLVGWWTFDGKDMTSNVADASGNGKNGNLIGQLATTTIAGISGQGLRFDGVDDYVTIGSVSNSVDTVSFWLKADNTTNKIIDLNGSASIEVSGGTIVANNITSPTIYTNGVVSSIVTSGVWYYVVVTTATPINASAVDIGRISSGYFPGSLDDIRIYNRALSATEVLQLYNQGAGSKQNVAPKSANSSGLLGWWTMDGKNMTSNIADSSGNNNLIFLQTSSATSTKTGQIGQALGFASVDDEGIVADESKIFTTSGTFATWIKSGVDACQTVFSDRDNAYNNYFAVTIGNGSTGFLTNELIEVDTGVGGASANRVGYTTANRNELFDNKWHHIVLVAGADYKIYIDGVSKTITVGNGSNDGSFLGDSNYTEAYLAGDGIPGDCDNNMTLDDTRLYGRTLSQTEVTQLYNEGAGGKQNTTVVPPLSSGLVGHWTFDGKDMTSNVADTSGQGNNGTLNHFSSVVTTPGKTGQALTFDGIDDFVSAGNAASLQLTGSHTLSAWVKGNDVSPDDDIISKSGSTGYAYLMNLDTDLGTRNFVCGVTPDGNAGNLALKYSSTVVSLNIWYLVTCVYNASAQTLNIYINGALETGTTAGASVPASVYNNSEQVEIGARDSGFLAIFTGAIDDARIYNRALSATEVKQLYNAAH